ncbi:MAG: complex I subunit 1 family protein [Candidatus Hodarchaeales archaeon]|jgi:NADH-quinone oxidoreductase subunit H
MVIEDIILNIIRYLIFPGIFFTVGLAFWAQYVDRKLWARSQNRIGPPKTQPIWDFVKLIAKRDDPPNEAEPEFQLYPPVMLLLAFLTAALIPIYAITGAAFSFPGDIFFFTFLITIHGAIAFLIGWSSHNAYAVVGSSRDALTEISVELPFILTLLVPAIIAGSFRISDINELLWSKIADNPLFLIPWFIALLMIIILSLAILEKPPFDAGHAESEIVMGWMTELKGKSLAMIILSEDIFAWVIAGFIGTIFLPTPFIDSGSTIAVLGGEFDILGILANTIIFFIKTTLILATFTIFRATQGRLRIDQIVSYFWRVFLPISLFSLTLVVVLGGYI